MEKLPTPKPLESQVPTLHIPTQEEISNITLITRTDSAKAGTTYVVMDRHRSTVVKNPGQESTFKTFSKKRAEEVARACNGVVEPLLDAIRLVSSCACNLPPEHPHYNPDPRVKIVS